MATSLLALLDDITTLLDDVSAMTKVAAAKTSGVVGDDLALNAQQVSGVRADRELPVVWAVAKGSFVNKLILVPLALLISTWAPRLVTPLLMLGGAYLCYEGVEKIAHKLLHSPQQDAAHHVELVQDNAAPDVLRAEKDKVKGAIRTDFILSAEIIVISLGTVATAALPQRMMVLSLIAVMMTVGVYGLVGCIVKLDDFGLWLQQRARTALGRAVGTALLQAMPWLMRALAVLGTLAMFLVGGGILVHGIAPLAHWMHQVELGWGVVLGSLTTMLLNLGAGLLAGAAVLAAVTLMQKLRGA